MRRLGLAFALLALAPPGAAQPLCNLSACVSRSAPGFVPGPCPDGVALDFGGNPRRLRFRDGSLGCSAGAWGFYVADPALPPGSPRVPVFDAPVECAELLRLCPWAPASELPGDLPAPPVLLE